MHERLWKALLTGLAAVTLAACPGPSPAADEDVGPTLSLAGASGVSAEVSREVSMVDSTGSVRLMSRVDTTIWAPFTDGGAALASDVGAGTPAPLGWRASDAFAAAYGSRYAAFVDSAGVLHELRLRADLPGPWTRIEYRRAGRMVLEQRSAWNAADGGWVLGCDTTTYHLDGATAVTLRLDGRRMRVAQTGLGLPPFASAAGLLGAWLAPRPLAAQFYFGPCAGDWLKWMGAALLSELAWGRFLRTKSPSDFKKALAATSAAGVALSGLVDCMIEQPEQPDPGN